MVGLTFFNGSARRVTVTDPHTFSVPVSEVEAAVAAKMGPASGGVVTQVKQPATVDFKR